MFCALRYCYYNITLYGNIINNKTVYDCNEIKIHLSDEFHPNFDCFSSGQVSVDQALKSWQLCYSALPASAKTLSASE